MTQSAQGWPPESELDAGDGSEANASGLWDTPGQRWYSCDRCGFLFPMKDTVIEENSGLRVCTTGPTCYDRPDSNDPRQRGLAASRLFPGAEEVTEDGGW